MTKKQLKNKLEKIEVTYNYDKVYSDLYNTVIDYMNKSQDWGLEEYFNNFVDSDTVEEMLKHELERGGLARVRFFINDITVNEDLYKLDGYGNLKNISYEDLRNLKDDLIAELE